MKKFLKFTFVAIITFSFFLLHVTAELKKEESWYKSVCYDPDLAVVHKADCKEYQTYLAEQAETASRNANELEADLEKIRADILEAAKERRVYELEINEIRTRMAQVDGLIVAKETAIENQEIAIQEKQAEIDEIDAFVQELMRYQQSHMNFNSHVEFVMEADSLVDLLLRMSAIEDIGKYNQSTLEKLKILIEELNLIKEQLLEDKAQLDELRAQIKKEEATVAVLLVRVAEIEKELLIQEVEFEAKLNRIYSEIDNIQEIFNNIAGALDEIPSTIGWTRPANNVRMSAGAWYYPASFGGGVHLGVDYAGPIGTAVYAAGNGVVIASANACPTTGYLGSSCGYPGSGGGGNQVYLLTRINGNLYVVKYLHMRKDTVVKTGTVVNAGDKIGEIGSSGNSSGAHVHVEIFYLGDRGINEYINSWRGDLAFGAGWGVAALNNRCEVNGNRAPCRLKPQDIFGS